MKRFEVLYRTLDPVPQVRVDPVDADYCKLEPNGSLVFRRSVPNGYPEIVRAYAPGRWLELIGG